MAIKHRFVKLNLIFASVFTLIFITVLLLIPLLGLTLISEVAPSMIGTGMIFYSLILNSILFFKSPSLIDSAIKSQYSALNWNSAQYIQDAYPISYSCIQRICKKYKISEPIIAIVDDKMPLAFTYGNFLHNARIVVSSELLNLLTDEELAAVYAHELGHIVRYDFAVMTLAQGLTISLYMVGTSLLQGVNSGSNVLVVKAIGLVSLALYYIGFIASLFLSRIREFSADDFAAKNVSDPSALSRALVKIVYQSASLKRINPLAQSTRALNILDLSVKKSIFAKKEQETQDPIQNLFYPSSRWEELMSTHPFPINRINALSDYSKQKGRDCELNITEIISNIEKNEIASNDVNSESEHLTDSNFQTESRLKILEHSNRVTQALACLMFVAGGFFLLFTNTKFAQEKAMAIIWGIICLLMGITGFVAVLLYKHPGYILLSNAGIEIQYPSFFGKKGEKSFFKWSDIEEIGVYNSNVKGIGFNFSDNYTGPMQNFMNINKVFFGYDFILYNSFELKTEELCYTLQKWKNFYS